MTGEQTKSRPTMQAGCAAEQQMQTKTTVSGRAMKSMSFNPLRNRCGFVFFYGYYFTFFGYRQTPARAGARTMPA
jgi:hypothetical protein